MKLLKFSLTGLFALLLMSSAYTAFNSPTLHAEQATPQHRVKLPADYQNTFKHYASIDRSNPKQIAELYANQIAIDSLKKGEKMDNGSVLIMEIYNAKLDADDKPVLDEKGRRIKAGMKVIAVREKQAGWGAVWDEEVRNEDWDSVFYSPSTKQPLEKDYKACQECHKPLDTTDYTFSYEQLKTIN